MQTVRFVSNPHRAPNARSMSDLVNAHVLHELGHDRAELIGRITETFEGPGFSYSPDHTYVVLLHIPGKGYSVVVFDDEGPEYFEGYSGIPDAALAQKAAHFIHGVYSNHAVDLKLRQQLNKYKHELG